MSHDQPSTQFELVALAESIARRAEVISKDPRVRAEPISSTSANAFTNLAWAVVRDLKAAGL